jgi:dTDP-4-amino-4,6-dideoxygalactose transaminase
MATALDMDVFHQLEHIEQEYSYKIEKADVFYNCIVNLPCSSNLKIVDVERVADSIKKFENNT